MTKRERLQRLIGEAVGEASMCWEPRPTGVFDSTLASGVVDRTVAAIEALIHEPACDHTGIGLPGCRICDKRAEQ